MALGLLLENGEEIVALTLGSCVISVRTRRINGKTRRVKGAEAEKLLAQFREIYNQPEEVGLKNGRASFYGLPESS